MDVLYKFLSPETVYALGIMLMHFMWQALVVALSLGFFMLLTRKSSPVPRYYAAIFSMFLLPAMAIYTFISTMQSIEVMLATQPGYKGNIPQIAADLSLMDKFINMYTAYLPLIVLVWFIGITALLLKNIGGLLFIQRLKNYYIEPVSDSIKQIVEQIQGKYLIRKVIKPLISIKASTPMVIGHFKPVVLIPKLVAQNLSPEELKIVLQHELAHIKRNDFIINIFQIFIETIFFFHPATWWISHMARHEREECCDAYAAQTGDEKITLAKALTSIQEYKLKTPTMAVTFLNKKSGLYNRISNLFGNRPSAPSFREGIIVMLFVITSILIMSFVAGDNNGSSGKNNWKTINAELSNGEFLFAKVDSVGIIKELFVEGKRVRKSKIPYYQSKVDSIQTIMVNKQAHTFNNLTNNTINDANANELDEALNELGKNVGFKMDVNEKDAKVNMSANDKGFDMDVNDGKSHVQMNFGENGVFMDVKENGKTTFHMNIGSNGMEMKIDTANSKNKSNQDLNTTENKDIKDSETESALRQIAFHDSDDEMRLKAVSKIKDQTTLLHVAFFDQDIDVKTLAVSKLTSQSSLQHVAFFNEDVEIRKLAVSKLTDKTALQHVAKFDSDIEIRKMAEDRLK